MSWPTTKIGPSGMGPGGSGQASDTTISDSVPGGPQGVGPAAEFGRAWRRTTLTERSTLPSRQATAAGWTSNDRVSWSGPPGQASSGSGTTGGAAGASAHAPPPPAAPPTPPGPSAGGFPPDP